MSFLLSNYVVGDDLQPAAVAIIILRSIQILFFISPLLAHIVLIAAKYGWAEYFHLQPSQADHCETAHQYPFLLLSYEGASLIFCLVSILLETYVYRISSIGTPTEPQLRSPKISKLLKLKLTVVFLANVAIFVLGICTASAVRWFYICRAHDTSNSSNNNEADDWVDPDNQSLEDNPLNFYFAPSWWVTLILLLTTQAIEVLMSSLSWCLFLQLPKAKDYIDHITQDLSFGGSSMLHHHSHYESVEEMWENRCRVCCKVSGMATCFLFGGREIDGGEFGHIARILTDYFEDGGVLDVVPSDIVMGFMTLWRVQKQRQMDARRDLLKKVSLRSSSRTMDCGGSSSTLDVYKENGMDIRSPSLLRRRVSEGALVQHGSGEPINDLQRAAITQMIADDLLDGTPGYANARNDLTASPPTVTDPILPKQNDSLDELQISLHTNPREALIYKIHHSGSRHWYDCTFRNCLSRDDDYDRLTMAEGARFARHSLAIYTWKLFVYMYPVQGVCRLACPRWNGKCARHIACHHDIMATNCGCCGQEYGQSHRCVEGDNCCRLHEAALLAQAGLDESELVYARFDNGLIETPYCVVVDRKWRSIVLSIRGSLSLEDCVMDVLCDPESLENLGCRFGFDGQGEYCHSGVVSRVEWLYEDLER